MHRGSPGQPFREVPRMRFDELQSIESGDVLRGQGFRPAVPESLYLVAGFMIPRPSGSHRSRQDAVSISRNRLFPSKPLLLFLSFENRRELALLLCCGHESLDSLLVRSKQLGQTLRTLIINLLQFRLIRLLVGLDRRFRSLERHNRHRCNKECEQTSFHSCHLREQHHWASGKLYEGLPLTIAARYKIVTPPSSLRLLPSLMHGTFLIRSHTQRITVCRAGGREHAKWRACRRDGVKEGGGAFHC